MTGEIGEVVAAVPEAAAIVFAAAPVALVREKSTMPIDIRRKRGRVSRFSG